MYLLKSSPGSSFIRSLTGLSGALLVTFLIPIPPAQAFVYETPLEFISTGDFNGDGQQDVLLLSRDKGRVRIGYSLGGGIFDWSDWRESGVKSVTGVSVGKLFDAKRDGIAATSTDTGLLAVLDAASSTKPTDPVSIPVSVIGPNVVVALDVPGEGNTPLVDLLVSSIYNADDNPNKVTIYRNNGGKFSQLSESAVPVAGAHANLITLKPGGRELPAVIGTGESGTRLLVGTVESGQPVPIFAISNVTAGADFVVGNFRGAAASDIVIYSPGSPEVTMYGVSESGGTFQPGAAKKFTLEEPVKQLVVAPGDKRSRLIAVFTTNEAAQLLEFDGGTAPVKVQQLWGATNKVLQSVVTLADYAILLSTMTTTGRVVSHYQVYERDGDKYKQGSYGALPTLDDRDDATVPAIHARIVANLKEKSAADMKGYTNMIPGTDIPYSMVAIPGGEFVMGSPANEPERNANEGPQHRVKISPFWMGQFEMTWDAFLLYMYPDDEKKLRQIHGSDPSIDEVSDAVTRPTKPYVDMSFGMGKSGYPAIAMTQHGANKFCHWLSAKTGHFYRLPTEAEWEYACRAGTTTAYSFGNDASSLTNYAWFFDNANDKYQRVGRKLPNQWGLFDMYGNVREWTLDQYDENYYASFAGKDVVVDPWNKATKPYPHATRGGSWFDEAAALRSAARIASDRTWKMTDPQLPKSRWWLSDALWIGVRLVRPLKTPSPEEMVKYWTSGVDKD